MRVSARVVGSFDPAKLDRLVFKNDEVIERDFTGARHEFLTVVESRFERCRFERCRFDTASFGAGQSVSEYVDCSFDGSRIRSVATGFSRFARCSFRDVNIRDWSGEHVDLVDCVFSGRIKSAMFWGRPIPVWAKNQYESMVRHREKEGLGPPSREYRELVLREANDFYGNDFSQAELIKVSFRYGIDLTKQRLPTGPDYLYLGDAPAAIEEAVSKAADIEPAELRESVTDFLTNIIGRSVAVEGQRQLFLREKNFKPSPRVATGFALLRSAAQSSAPKPASG